MMLTISNIDSNNISVNEYGGKAHGLSILLENELPVPKTIAIQKSTNPGDIENPNFIEALKEILNPFSKKGLYSVAIRSSCTIEDGFTDSKAGHFSTFIGQMTFDEVICRVKDVISGIKEKDISEGAGMGVLIQEKIDSDYSGVLFSSDPISFRKDCMILTYTEGMGDKLVSGKVAGKEVLVSVEQDKYLFKIDSNDSIEDQLQELFRETKKLEGKLGYPIDIEWAISKGKLYFLQCRPLTNITSVQTQLIKVNEKNLLGLPQQLVSSDKINLRLMAEKEKIFISDAYAYIKNNCCLNNPELKLEQSEFCKGYSSVIIYPKKVSDKVIRSFVGEKMKVYGNVTGCCRYGIRSFPEYEDLGACLEGFSEKLKNEYWISTTIVQEIFDPEYTGVIQRIPEGFLIEITKGHFLTKGIVPVSQYIISSEGVVLEREEVHQEEWLKILEGHVINCTCSIPEETLVSLNDNNLNKIIEAFKPVLVTDTNVVEFGVLSDEKDDIIPYLIDFVDDNSPIDISAIDINSGIISFGKISGTPVIIDSNREDSLNQHFHDEMEEKEKKDDRIIFICDNPELSLLSLIETYKPENIGFVFQNCAMGSHFAVILREKRIPAIKLGEAVRIIPNGSICTIDASTSGLTPKQRIKFEKNGNIIEF